MRMPKLREGGEAMSGKLTAEQVREIIAPHLDARPTFDFGRHGAVWRADFQAIADELNAALGSGECENVSKLNRDGVAAYFFTCSECGLSVCAGVGIGEIELKSPLRFVWKHGMYEFERCPRCGKAVKR